MRKSLPTGKVTFLFTDVERSTSMRERNEAKAEAAISALDDIVLHAVESNRGHVVLEKGEGDSHFCVFSDAADAVRASIEVQRKIAAHPWDPEAVVKVRMAVHCGVAEMRGRTYQGLAVVRCARIRSCGHGGQILASQAVVEAVRPNFDGQIVPLGRHWLRDLKEPEQVFQINVDGNERTFPPLLSVEMCPTNLPTRYSSFVGREGELAALDQAVRHRPVVTVTGPGGTGKTRLSMEVANAVRDEFPAGVWFIAMADYANRNDILHGLANAIELPLDAEQPEETLFSWLENRRALIVLDNAEHILDDVAGFANSMLRRCRRLAILCTSRQPLGLSGEFEFPVRPLSTPPSTLPHEWAMQYEAYALLIDRALDRDPTLSITEEESAAFCRIARLLDGLPLAIELAVPRLRTTSAMELATRLESSMAGLGSMPRNHDIRHRTIRAAIEWSYRLLTPDEQRLLNRLSTFIGGWDMTSARAIAGTDLDEEAFIEAFDGLVEKSLAYSEYLDGGQRRFRLLDLIRQFAAEKLKEEGEVESLARRHAEYFRDQAGKWYALALQHDSTAAIREFETDRENAHQGLRWAIARDLQPLEYAFPLSRLWLLSGRYREGQELLEASLASDHSSSDAIRAKAMQRLGSIHWDQGNAGDAQSAYGEALAIARRIGATTEVAAALSNLGMTAASNGYDELAIKQFRLAFRLVKNLDPQRARAIRYNMNGMLIEQGRLEEALVVSRQIVDEFLSIGEPEEALDAMTTLAMVNCRVGKTQEAVSVLQETLDLIEAHSKQSALLYLILTLGECAVDLGDPEVAGTCLAMLEKMDGESGHRFAGMDLERFQELKQIANPVPLADDGAEPCTILARLVGRLKGREPVPERA